MNNWRIGLLFMNVTFVVIAGCGGNQPITKSDSHVSQMKHSVSSMRDIEMDKQMIPIQKVNSQHIEVQPKEAAQETRSQVEKELEQEQEERPANNENSNQKSGQPKERLEQKKKIVVTQKEKEAIPKAVKKEISTINSFLPDENSEPRTTEITHVMLHFTSNAVSRPHHPFEVEDIRKIFIDYGVSAHYLINRNGDIHQLVPEERVAYHAGKGNLEAFPQYKDQLNHYSIGIELMAIGTKHEMQTMMSEEAYDSIPKEHIGYTDEQYRALQRLLDDILARNPSIGRDRNHIVGHDEYAPERKTDPGSLFEWSKLKVE